MKLLFLQVVQFGEQVVGNPENQEAAEAISHRREQFAEQISVEQPHDAEVILARHGGASFVAHSNSTAD